MFCEYVYCADAATTNDSGVTSHAVEQACDRAGGGNRRERRSEQLRADSGLLHMSTDDRTVTSLLIMTILISDVNVEFFKVDFS